MFGHPRGLTTLFFTEFWERFSFYGIRALLVLYMTAAVADGGLGFRTAQATSIYGWYLMLVYLTALPGGILADRWLGQRRAVLIGGLIIALGNFALVVREIPFFYLGLALIIIGTGLLKPNVSTMVGGLYGPQDSRRDGGFTIFYMGINLGAFLAPLICGWIAQSPSFVAWARGLGFTITAGWNWAFAVAGVGMVLGLIQYKLSGDRLLGDVGLRPAAAPATAGAIAAARADGSADGAPQRLTPTEKQRLLVIGVLFFFSMLFWSAFEQAGSTMNMFARDFTRNRIFGFDFPSSWFQSTGALLIIIFAPLFAWLWTRLARAGREPSGPGKFALGLLGVGLGFVVLWWAARLSGPDGLRVAPYWLLSVFLLHTWGELCLSPVGLSLMTKLAPVRIGSFVMGLWFTSTALGNGLGGWIAGFYETEGGAAPSHLFAGIALYCLIAAALLALLIRPIKRATAAAP
jgi:POT family proton-dependent oligopeptide transporter